MNQERKGRRRAAAFSLEGILTRANPLLVLLNHLRRQRIISSEDEVRGKEAGKIRTEGGQRLLLDLVMSALERREADWIEPAFIETVDELIRQVNRFPEYVARQIAGTHTRVIVDSWTPVQVVRDLGIGLGLDGGFAVTPRKVGDIFDSSLVTEVLAYKGDDEVPPERKALWNGDKGDAVRRLQSSLAEPPRGHSLAMGGLNEDLPMLEAVLLPIAFNPTLQIFLEARQRGWPIVLEWDDLLCVLDLDNYTLFGIEEMDLVMLTVINMHRELIDRLIEEEKERTKEVQNTGQTTIGLMPKPLPQSESEYLSLQPSDPGIQLSAVSDFRSMIQGVHHQGLPFEVSWSDWTFTFQEGKYWLGDSGQQGMHILASTGQTV